MTAGRDAWLALALTPGIGPDRFARLVARFETPLGALSAPFALLGTVPGISRAAATSLDRQTPDAGARVRREVERMGGRCLLPPDPEFPEILKTIPQPPTMLFSRGNLELLSRPAIAIVGSRDHSDYGREVARAVARCAARAGVVVVSGMARGLDAEAHAAALEAGGGTIGVLGNGLGVIYPAANRSLYRAVAEQGLLLTEFPPGDRPHAGSFPRRNRIISGLARVTVVAEAASGSGTLITVEAALEQGRDVMAVPGPITSPTSVGTNRLIGDGAHPLLVPGDLLRFYDGVLPATCPPVSAPAPAPAPAAGRISTGPGLEPASTAPDLEPREARLYGALGRAPVHLDVLAETLRRPVAEVLDGLCALELAGLVEQRPGRLFVRL